MTGDDESSPLMPRPRGGAPGLTGTSNWVARSVLTVRRSCVGLSRGSWRRLVPTKGSCRVAELFRSRQLEAIRAGFSIRPPNSINSQCPLPTWSLTFAQERRANAHASGRPRERGHGGRAGDVHADRLDGHHRFDRRWRPPQNRRWFRVPIYSVPDYCSTTMRGSAATSWPSTKVSTVI